ACERQRAHEPGRPGACDENVGCGVRHQNSDIRRVYPLTWSFRPQVRSACQYVAMFTAMTGLPSQRSVSSAMPAIGRLAPNCTSASTPSPSMLRIASIRYWLDTRVYCENCGPCRWLILT